MRALRTGTSGVHLAAVLLCLGQLACGSAGAPAAASPAPAAVVPAGLAGTWYLNADGERAWVIFSWDARAAVHTAVGAREDSAWPLPDPIDSIAFDPASGRVSFRWVRADGARFYRGRIAGGVLVGR